MKLISLTHANLNESVMIVKDLVAAFYYSATHKACLVLFNGGAMLPVKESLEEIERKIKGE